RPIFIGRAIDLKTGTIPVRAEFPNPKWILRPGQFGRVRAVTQEVPDAILVPQIAVHDLQGAKTVLVVGEGDKVAQRTVTLREPYEQFYIVSAGLKAGERVIVEGIQKARPGMQVKPELKAASDVKPAPDQAQPPAGPPPAGPPPPAPPPPRPAGTTPRAPAPVPHPPPHRRPPPRVLPRPSPPTLRRPPPP